MSLFEKIVVPFLVPELNNLYFTDIVGFKDCYTHDLDNPSTDKEFFIMFDNRVYNEYTVKLARKLNVSVNVKKCYVKIIDSIPYTVYSFFVTPEVKQFYKGLITLTLKQKQKYIDFWGESDKDAETISKNSTLVLDVNHDMPLSDYVPPEIPIYK